MIQTEEDSTKAMLKVVEEQQECIDRSYKLYVDIVRQIGGLAIQDYHNLNALGILLEKYRTKNEKTLRSRP